MSVPFAFFDTCSRLPNRTNSRFIMASNMKKVDKAILGAVHVSERLVAPLLSTTCFGYQRANAKMNIGGTVDALAAAAVSGTEADTAFIRLDATPADVAKAMACRCLVIERLSCPTPDENVARRTFDVFSNPNTELIVDALGERHWLLFGAGFEHCLLAAAEGLRARNHRVTILEDAVIHGGRSTPQTFRATLHRLNAAGVEWATLDAVLEAAPVR